MSQTQMDLTFSALGNSTRREILVRLSKGEASVGDLSKPFRKSMSAPAITKHLKVLEKARLISRTRRAQWRPCQLKGEPLKDASEWLEHYRKFWEERLDRLDVYLKTINKNERKKNGCAK